MLSLSTSFHLRTLNSTDMYSVLNWVIAGVGPAGPARAAVKLTGLDLPSCPLAGPSPQLGWASAGGPGWQPGRAAGWAPPGAPGWQPGWAPAALLGRAPAREACW
ncbi:unnamed protein product [Prorocentrum cordatum]|uniref:Subtilisin n=1 Tax=Prorocentrum cordatum TaxID=2364126 RepID=A0ABN9QM79_9DINO|nr:unnamed protein product [Polarella glacialis]